MYIMRIVFYTGFEVRLVCPGTNMTNLQLSFSLSQKQYYEKKFRFVNGLFLRCHS